MTEERASSQRPICPGRGVPRRGGSCSAQQESGEGRPCTLGGCRPASKKQKVRWELHTGPFLTPGRPRRP